jgi:hypothetical protein
VNGVSGVYFVRVVDTCQFARIARTGGEYNPGKMVASVCEFYFVIYFAFGFILRIAFNFIVAESRFQRAIAAPLLPPKGYEDIDLGALLEHGRFILDFELKEGALKARDTEGSHGWVCKIEGDALKKWERRGQRDKGQKQRADRLRGSLYWTIWELLQCLYFEAAHTKPPTAESEARRSCGGTCGTRRRTRASQKPSRCCGRRTWGRWCGC